jgi:hypothetical protein
MNIVRLERQTIGAWNEIAAEAAEGWFWHTPEWLEFVKAVGASSFLDDLSSLIVLDQRPIAVCPVILEERGGYRRFSYFGEFVPFPAFRAGISESTRDRAIEVYAGWLAETALARSVAYTRVMLPTLSAAAANGHSWNPLLRHGYMEVSAASQILNLDEDLETLWRQMRKGHRSDVKRAAAHCEAVVWDAQSVTTEIFDRYRTLHAIDAGRVTRGPETFEMMLSWIRAGRGVLVEARQNSTSIAFAVIIAFREGAYYASSCKAPDVPLPSMHLIQWETITWLKAHGIRRYDIGMQHYGPTWAHVPTPKELSIASFKRGFGGSTRRIDVVERFYSPEILRQVGAERMQALLAGREQHTP